MKDLKHMAFHLSIITPDRQVFSEDVENVSVPTLSGTIGVLSHHTPLFSLLTQGEIKVVQEHKDLYLAIGEGFIEITKTGVSILVSRAFHAHELNEQEIQKAYASAKDVLLKRGKGGDMASAQAMLRRSFFELKVLRRRGPHRAPSYSN